MGDNGLRPGGSQRGPAGRAASYALRYFLPVSWRHARRAAGSLHALAERHPAWGGAPRRGATPSQGWQERLAWEGGLCGFPSRALGAQRSR